jgi:hypothetical protein
MATHVSSQRDLALARRRVEEEDEEDESLPDRREEEINVTAMQGFDHMPNHFLEDRRFLARGLFLVSKPQDIS